MWKFKDVERSAEEWATIMECITVYMNHDTYPSVNMIVAMLGIEKESPAEPQFPEPKMTNGG